MSNEKAKWPKHPPSDEFMEEVRTSGSYQMTCDFCGRTFFDNSDRNSWDWEEGQRERLQKLAEEKPDEYFGWDGSIGSGEIDGRIFVEGCPCNAIRRHEDFIWDHRSLIASYLKTRARQELTEAKQQLDGLKGLNAIERLGDASFDLSREQQR